MLVIFSTQDAKKNASQDFKTQNGQQKHCTLYDPGVNLFAWLSIIWVNIIMSLEYFVCY